MKKPIIIDNPEDAVDYIKYILDNWDAWKTHHGSLVQALEILVAENERLRADIDRTIQEMLEGK